MDREQKLWLLLAFFGGINVIAAFYYKPEFGLQIAIVGWITLFYSAAVFTFLNASYFPNSCIKR